MARHHNPPKRPQLAAVPPAPASTAAPSYQRVIELPTGGHRELFPLLDELASFAFRGALVSFTKALDPRLGPRCHVSVQVTEKFTHDQVEEARASILRALFALGIIKPAKPADEPPAVPAAARPDVPVDKVFTYPADGAESPLPAPQSPPT